MKKINHADLLLIVVSIMWGGGFIATKDALDTITPFYTMALRFPIAAILLMIVSFKNIKNITKYALKGGLITGTFLFLAFAFQTLGINHTTASKNAFLTATNVILVPYLLWIIIKRKPDKYQIISSLMCVIGIGLITMDGSGVTIQLGDILSFVGAIFFACHIICLDYFSKKINVVILTIIQLATAGGISIGAAVAFEDFPVGLTGSSWSAVMYLAIVSTLLAYVIQTYAQKHTTASKTSLILATEAVFASIFSAIFLGEKFTIIMLIGGAIVFLSVIVAETKLKFND